MSIGSILRISALVAVSVAAPAHPQSGIPSRLVVELCAAHHIHDVICDMADAMQRRNHKIPCWEKNKC